MHLEVCVSYLQVHGVYNEHLKAAGEVALKVTWGDNKLMHLENTGYKVLQDMSLDAYSLCGMSSINAIRLRGRLCMDLKLKYAWIKV